jgi:hypothetical protein
MSWFVSEEVGARRVQHHMLLLACQSQVVALDVTCNEYIKIRISFMRWKFNVEKHHVTARSAVPRSGSHDDVPFQCLPVATIQ